MRKEKPYQPTTEYVIYCRKSTDESTKKQSSSIPQQIEACILYAEREGLIVKEKPEPFEFETDAEIAMEDNEPEIADRQVYRKYRNLYIIRERKTAKNPGVRSKWNRLMKLVESGKIRGILSYAPDRQARNLLEAGYLIDLVDNDRVELKYANFAFEPNAAGKMMLGIWFVFSKQYSDKLGEDGTRGSEGKVEDWKAIWKHKYGYDINEEGYHYQHPEDFLSLQEAFRIKIEEDKSDEYLAKWLRSKWVGRKYRKEGKSTSLISARVLNDLWKDPFYYGIFEYSDLEVDLREKNPYYVPMITEEEHTILIERYYGNRPHMGKKEAKDEHTEVMPFEEQFIKTADGSYLSFNLPNKKRFMGKLAELKKTNPKATLKDVVQPNQIRYGCKNKKSEFYNFEITFDQIESLILEKFKSFHVDDEHYDEYRAFMEGRYKERQTKLTQEKRTVQRNRNATDAKLTQYVLRNGGIKRDETEERVYSDEKKRLENLIANMDEELRGLSDETRNEIVEFESFFQILNNADRYYKKASYVQKRMISKILFSNILVTHEKTLQIQPKPGLEGLFSWNSNVGSATENRTPVCGMKTRRPDH